MNYTRQTDFTDLRETLNRIDNVLTESVLTEREVSITTLNRWAKYAKDVADYMGNQLSRGDTIPTTMDSFLKNSGYSDERKQAIKDDPYYFNNIKKVALAVNNNDLNSLGSTGPKSEMGTSFGGGGDATVTGRERQIKLDPALRNLQGLAKEKDNASNTTEYYSPLPPKDLEFVLHGTTADAIELSGSLSDTVEPTWDGQTADEIRAELDQIHGGRENWINSKEWDMGDGVTSTFDRTGRDIEATTRTDPARDPAGQIITDPESDTPLETPMDWDMDDIDTQFKELDKEYSDNASIRAVDNEIDDLNKAMDTTDTASLEKTDVAPEPKDDTNYGAMSDEDYTTAYDKKMDAIIAKGYDPTNPDYNEKEFDADMWKQLGKLDSVRASQKKDTKDDKRAEWDMNRATDQFAKLDKEMTDREAKAKDNKERAYMYSKMADAEDQFTKLDKQYTKDNPEGFDKVSQQAGKAWDEIVKTGSELGDYAEIDKVVDTVTKGAGDAYDYVAKGGINKDASKLKKYIQSPQAGKDAKAKGAEHKAYVDKKAGDVGDYFTGGEFGKDVDDASDWISSQWNSLFGDDKKESVAKNTTTDKPL